MMDIKILLEEKKVVVEFSDELLPSQIYNIGCEINFTELVKLTSGINQMLKIEPRSLEEFNKTTKCDDNATLKVIEYIYKILNAYIESYEELCPEIIKIESDKDIIA